MHLVHYNGQYNSVDEAANMTGGLVVLGVFVEVLLPLFSACLAADGATYFQH